MEGKTAGGICAVNYDGEISYCYNAGKVTGSSAGAICGINQSNSTITNCYYSKDICSVVRVSISDGSVVQAEGISTKKLSDITNLSGFDPTVWETGAAGAVEISSNNFSIQEYTLPSLKSFNKAQKVKINVYNFSVDGNDDWDEYTPITTAEELQNINRTALSGNYVLMKDINVAEELNSKYNNWKPIGNYTSPFTGKFSGEGHIVSKINISNSSDYQGLFGYSTGVIKDVGVEDSSISGSNCVGGVCGLNTGIIERCYNTSYIHSSGENAGGICGSSSGADAKIQNCYNTGNVNGDYSGGICGNNSIGMISDCYSTGKISGRTFQGSICGFNSFDSSNYPNVKNCYYSKDICKLGGINNSDETEQAEGISTEELCNITSLSGFDTDIWENGSVTVNGNFRESIFPRLKNVGKQNEVYKDYNFGVGGQDNWETYTPIYTAEALQNINNDLSGNYVLMNDIDVAKVTNKTENNWTPLGPIRVFYGKFSGDGHVVSGININMPNRDTQGLFGNSTGVIKNVGVENNSIIGSAMVGGICGYNRGKIENCSSVEMPSACPDMSFPFMPPTLHISLL